MKKRNFITAAFVAILVVVGGIWFFAPGVVYQLSMAIERNLAGLEIREVQVDGHKWVYAAGGDGPPLLLIHGFSADKDNWSRIGKYLNSRFSLYAPDLPGFGESDEGSGGYSIAAQADHVFSYLDVLGLKAVHVAGSSMGGQVALAMARRHPERVLSLWLLAPAGVSSAPASEMFNLIIEQDINPLIPTDADDFSDTLNFVFEQRPYLPGPVIRYLAHRQVALGPRYQAIFDDLRYRSGNAETLARGLATPTLLVWGRQDRVLHPDGGTILRRMMPNADLIEMEGIGHLPMLEDPISVAADYLEWHARLPDVADHQPELEIIRSPP